MNTKEVRVDKCADRVINIDISIDENMLATCHNKDVRVWSAPTGKVIMDLKGIHSDLVTCAKFASCAGVMDSILVTTGRDNSVKIWDVRTWKQVGATFTHSRY
jgi:WD40 repeat protein